MDRMQDDTFDKKIREKFGSFEPKVPKDLWSDIAVQLDQQRSMTDIRQQKKKKTFIGWSIAATIVLVVGWGAWYMRPVDRVYLSANKKIIEEGTTQISADAPQSVGKSSLPDDIPDNDQVPVSHNTHLTDAVRLSAVAIRTKEVQLAANTSITSLARPVLENEVIAVEVPAYENKLVSETELRVTAIEIPRLDRKVLKEREKDDFGVSKILNYVVGSVDHGETKVLSFASDDEGTLKVAVDLKALKVKL